MSGLGRAAQAELDVLALQSARDVVKAEHKMQELRIEEQEAMTEKAKVELRIQQHLLELTEQHKKAVSLPELKLGGGPC